jgi:hypothetical protein
MRPKLQDYRYYDCVRYSEPHGPDGLLEAYHKALLQGFKYLWGRHDHASYDPYQTATFPIEAKAPSLGDDHERVVWWCRTRTPHPVQFPVACNYAPSKQREHLHSQAALPRVAVVKFESLRKDGTPHFPVCFDVIM